MLYITQDDITKLRVDAVVNAANSSLMGGGGVDGAIHRSGGPQILEECKVIRSKTGPCPAGEARITGAGTLPAQWLIHAVGPIWHQGSANEEELLRNCYKQSLRLAESVSAKSIAFPNISTGVYKFPKKLAAEIALDILFPYATKTNSIVYCCCFDYENYQIYLSLFEKLKKLSHTIT